MLLINLYLQPDCFIHRVILLGDMMPFIIAHLTHQVTLRAGNTLHSTHLNLHCTSDESIVRKQCIMLKKFLATN